MMLLLKKKKKIYYYTLLFRQDATLLSSYNSLYIYYINLLKPSQQSLRLVLLSHAASHSPRHLSDRSPSTSVRSSFAQLTNSPNRPSHAAHAAHVHAGPHVQGRRAAPTVVSSPHVAHGLQLQCSAHTHTLCAGAVAGTHLRAVVTKFNKITVSTVTKQSWNIRTNHKVKN